ncbi:hypothetical protein A0H81_09146 [Grifola frondosa]|uniref:Uncharacterized protein n=1 Tax=Grifola frondosa TaxID=5627 RepID=A0A1C7M1V9_GRIFR|nr:hypothetical protein A0H81_09146 [Grifola frondosa]
MAASYSLPHHKSEPSFIDFTQDILFWAVQDIISYIRRRCEAAEVDLLLNPTCREVYIIQVYRRIIVPALERKTPFVTNGGQTIEHVNVVENIGPSICITDFYSAFAYVITMTELAAQARHEESFYVQLVFRFAWLCYVMHHDYFKPNAGLGNQKGSPAKVHILWGPIGPSSRRPTLDSVDNHSFSLSTSLPRAKPVFRMQAQMLRKRILMRELLDGVDFPPLKNAQDYGYCAETLPFISRLSPNGTELKGLSVDVSKIGKLALYGPLEVSSSELCTPACLSCRKICNAVGHPVYDLANGQRYGQCSASPTNMQGNVTSDENSSATGSSDSDDTTFLSSHIHRFCEPPSLDPPSSS